MSLSYVRTGTFGATGALTAPTTVFSQNGGGNVLFAAFIAYGGSSPYTFPSTITDSYGNVYNLMTISSDVTFTQYSTYVIYMCSHAIASSSLVQTQYVNPDGSPVANGILLIRLSTDGVSSSKQIQSNFITIPLDSNGNVQGSVGLPLNSVINPPGTYYIGKVYNSSGQLVGQPFIAPVQAFAANTITSPTAGTVASRAMSVEFQGPVTSVVLDQSTGAINQGVSSPLTLTLPYPPDVTPVTVGDLVLGLALNVSGTCNASPDSTSLYTGMDSMLQYGIVGASPYTQTFEFTGGVGTTELLAAFTAS